VNVLAQDIDDAVTDLLAGTYQVMESPGSLLVRARAAVAGDEYPAGPQAPRAPQAPQAPLHALTGEELDRRLYDLELQRLAGNGGAGGSPDAQDGLRIRRADPPPPGDHVQSST
jgi:hypothetical protein